MRRRAIWRCLARGWRLGIGRVPAVISSRCWRSFSGCCWRRGRVDCRGAVRRSIGANRSCLSRRQCWRCACVVPAWAMRWSTWPSPLFARFRCRDFARFMGVPLRQPCAPGICVPPLRQLWLGGAVPIPPRCVVDSIRWGPRRVLSWVRRLGPSRSCALSIGRSACQSEGFSWSASFWCAARREGGRYAKGSVPEGVSVPNGLTRCGTVLARLGKR